MGISELLRPLLYVPSQVGSTSKSAHRAELSVALAALNRPATDTTASPIEEAKPTPAETPQVPNPIVPINPKPTDDVPSVSAKVKEVPQKELKQVSPPRSEPRRRESKTPSMRSQRRALKDARERADVPKPDFDAEPPMPELNLAQPNKQALRDKTSKRDAPKEKPASPGKVTPAPVAATGEAQGQGTSTVPLSTQVAVTALKPKATPTFRKFSPYEVFSMSEDAGEDSDSAVSSVDSML
jgi:hypothetical protein